MCVRCGTGTIAWCTDPLRHVVTKATANDEALDAAAQSAYEEFRNWYALGGMQPWWALDKVVQDRWRSIISNAREAWNTSIEQYKEE